MKLLLGGLQKTTLIDFPGRVACTVFTVGCNFRCPFCHNKDLVTKASFIKSGIAPISEKKIIKFLQKRKKILDGVCLSIAGFEPVIIKEKGRLKNIPIETIWENSQGPVHLGQNPIRHQWRSLSNIMCLTFKGFKKPLKILRHKVKRLYRITCSPGNYSISLTGAHSIFVLQKDGLAVKRVDELNKNDWLLAIKKIKTAKPIKTLNIKKYMKPFLKRNKNIRKEKIKYWSKIFTFDKEKTLKEIVEKTGKSLSTVCFYKKHYKTGFVDMLDEWVERNGFLKHKTSKVKIPVKIAITKELCEFLGYAVAEGSFVYKRKKALGNLTSLNFSLGDEKKLAERILLLYRKIFESNSGSIQKHTAYTGNTQYNVIVGNKIVTTLMRGLIGEGALNKRIPEIILNAEEDCKIGFIKALIKGDGHQRIRHHYSQQEYSFKTVSYRLASDFLILIKSLEAFGWVEKDGNAFRVVVSQNDLQKLHIKKRLKLNYSFNTRVEGIPRKLLGYSLRGQKRIAREKLARWLDLEPKDILDNRKKSLVARWGFLTNDSRLTKKTESFRAIYNLTENWQIKEVKKIERINHQKPLYVYDFFVKENNSFTGGLGGLLLHNSGGEPTIQPDLPRFLKKIKKLGLEVKLDTNGGNPKILKKLIDEKLVDFVAMDIKSCFDEYQNVTKCKVQSAKFKVAVQNTKLIKKIKESVKIILESEIEYELRTTVVPGIHDKQKMVRLAKELKRLSCRKPEAGSRIVWVLQKFRPQNCLDKSFLKIEPFADKQMQEILKAVKKVIPGAKLR